jgi:hypothetical protein
MQIQDSDFDLDVVPESPVTIAHDPAPRDAYQVRRLIERRAELKRLRELLGEPELGDFD